MLFISTNYVFSGEILIRSDNWDPGTVGSQSVKTILRSPSTSTSSLSPVTANQTAENIELFFASPIGIAYITIADQNGFIVCSEVVDTHSNGELYIPIEDLQSGHYTLRISYGTKKLIGEFQL